MPLHAQKALLKNNRYYAVVDGHSNIAVIKHRYHANLYLNGESWLYKRALADIPNYLCIISWLYILKLCVTIYRRIIISYDYPSIQRCGKLADSNRR